MAYFCRATAAKPMVPLHVSWLIDNLAAFDIFPSPILAYRQLSHILRSISIFDLPPFVFGDGHVTDSELEYRPACPPFFCKKVVQGCFWVRSLPLTAETDANCRVSGLRLFSRKARFADIGFSTQHNTAPGTLAASGSFRQC